MAYTWTTGEVITAEKLNNTGGDNRFIITFTENDGTWSADKTLDECIAAYEAGMTLIGVITIFECDYLHSLCYADTTAMIFGFMCIYGHDAPFGSYIKMGFNERVFDTVITVNTFTISTNVVDN